MDFNFKYKPYSFSKINTYRSCPKKFKYRYIDKIKTEQVEAQHLKRGKFLHLLLEYNGDLNKIKHTQDFKKLNLDKIPKETIKEWHQAYLKFTETEGAKKILSKSEIYKELEIGLSDDLKITNYGDNPLLRGYIDAVYKIDTPEKKSLLLVDWKSGNMPKKQNYDQLLYYSLALFDLIPQEKDGGFDEIYLVFAYIDADPGDSGKDNINIQKVHRNKLELYKNALLNDIATIENEEEFPKLESKLCEWCEYNEYCFLEKNV